MDRLAVEGAKTIRAGESVVVREPMDRLDQAFTDLAQYSWVIFTSRNAVKIFFERMHEKHVDLRKLGSLKFAAVGRGTGEYLANIGITPDLSERIHDEGAGRRTCGASERSRRNFRDFREWKTSDPTGKTGIKDPHGSAGRTGISV